MRNPRPGLASPFPSPLSQRFTALDESDDEEVAPRELQGVECRKALARLCARHVHPRRRRSRTTGHSLGTVPGLVLVPWQGSASVCARASALERGDGWLLARFFFHQRSSRLVVTGRRQPRKSLRPSPRARGHLGAVVGPEFPAWARGGWQGSLRNLSRFAFRGMIGEAKSWLPLGPASVAVRELNPGLAASPLSFRFVRDWLAQIGSRPWQASPFSSNPKVALARCCSCLTDSPPLFRFPCSLSPAPSVPQASPPPPPATTTPAMASVCATTLPVAPPRAASALSTATAPLAPCSARTKPPRP